MLRGKPVIAAKICGIRTRATYDFCQQFPQIGWLGFNAVAGSPRFITAESLAALPNPTAIERAQRVGVFVDPPNTLLASYTPYLDAIQLHGGEAESRLREIAQSFPDHPLIKVVSVTSKADIARLPTANATAAQMLLLDAPKDAAMHGGHRFDWQWLRAIPAGTPPILLAGGITPADVTELCRFIPTLAAPIVGLDVASGVEEKRGEKSHALIKDFVTPLA